MKNFKEEIIKNLKKWRKFVFIFRSKSDDIVDTNEFGYILTWIVQTLAGATYMIIFIKIFSIFFGFCSYLNTLINDFNGISSRFDDGITKNSKIKTLKVIIHHINFHSEILR